MTLKNTFARYKIYIISVIVLIIAAIPSVFFYIKLRQVENQLENRSSMPIDTSAAVIEEVGKLMELPDEKPTVATITDREKLLDQPFFAKSKNGDKVLIYTQNRKAILYDPVAKKIIDVAPINISSESGALANAPTPTVVPVNFILLNGTQTVGLTKTYEAKLIKEIPGAKIVDRDNAKKTDFAKSILIDVKGNNIKSQGIAQKLSLNLEKMPDSEAASPPAALNADFIIIIGSDYSGK